MNDLDAAAPISAMVSRITGLARSTIGRGLDDLDGPRCTAGFVAEAAARGR